jgi:signal transduction histidine kinase
MIDKQTLQEKLFHRHLDDVHRQRDRVFAWLMGAQWIFGVLLALIYSPYGWEGKVQSTHIHVWYAIFLGGALSGSSLVVTLLRPGWVVTRHWVAIAQMLWSALLIHLTGGRIETHFHVFGSLAFLAFYRDWKVLITATLAVSVDHLLRGLVWPESVYGITNPEWWRFLEHAFWVVFENVVLVMGILESHREMRSLALRQTDLEERVDTRTREVVAAKREVSDILDHMGQAIFTVGTNGEINREFSAHCRSLFATDRIAGRTASDLLGADLEGWLSTVIGADRVQWTLSESDPPAELRRGDRILELAYAPIYQGAFVDRVMIICRDVTEVRHLAEENRSMLDRLAQVGALDPALLSVFLEEAKVQLAIARGSSAADALRALHTLKGNARAYGLSALEQAAHEAERDQSEANIEDVARLLGEFDRLAREVLSKRTAREHSMPFSSLLPRIEAVVNDVAARVGKPAPDLEVSLDGLLIAPPVLEKLGGVLTQLVRNAIDHGIEKPSQRSVVHKDERGRVWLQASVDGDRLQLEVEDDGRGVDLARIRELALSRRMISEYDRAMHDDQAALELLFTPGFSTASSVTEISGRGVGLDVVRRSLRELGGDVGVRSAAGRGTIFMLSLPSSCATVTRSA